MRESAGVMLECAISRSYIILALNVIAVLRELPRAGIALNHQDIAAAYRYTAVSDSNFADEFARWLSVEHAWVVSSGRAALYLILSSLAKRSPRRAVIVPAHTCPTVPLAVSRAGLQVRLCDVNPATGNLHLESLADIVDDEILALVPVHMSGIPCDMRAVLAIARQHGVFVVEDCAQAAGAVLDGQKVGNFGDAAFFSLGRGKGFTAYEGGIGVGKLGFGEVVSPIRKQTEAIVLIKLLAMFLFFHPRLYWSIRALPLGWGNEVYDMDFDIGGVGNFRQGVALSVLQRLDEILSVRREKAAYLLEKFQGIKGVRLLELPMESKPSYPWLPLLVDNRDETVRWLRDKGLGASYLFTSPLNKYDYLSSIVPPGSYPGAEDVATHLMTLPTHKFVTQRDMDEMVIELAKVAC